MSADRPPAAPVGEPWVSLPPQPSAASELASVRAELEQLRVEYGQARDALDREKERRPRRGRDGVEGDQIGVLPAGTVAVEEWSVRWTWPDGRSEEMSCERSRGSRDTRTARQRAEHHAARHVDVGVAGEVLRRFVYTTPDEVVKRYEPDLDAPAGGTAADIGGPR